MTKPRLPPRPETELGRTKRRVFDLERRLAALTLAGAVPLGDAVISIAAANTPDLIKRFARYVCTGTDDQEVIELAMRLVAAGGTILLLPGDFYFSDVIVAGAISFAKIRIIGSGGHSDENNFAPGATTIHATTADGIIGGGNVDFEQIACRYDGDTTEGARGGVNVANVRDCTFFRMYGTASDTVERCEYYGDYGGRGTTPIGSSIATGKRIKSCLFAMSWRDGNAIWEPTIEVVGCRFEFPFQYFGAEESPLFEELAIRTCIAIAHDSVHIRGNTFSFGQGGDGGACEYGVFCYEGSRLSIITDNAFSITALNPDGFPAPGPEIAAAGFDDSFITVRNNVTSSLTADTPGDLSSVSISQRYLEEQGFGT